MSEKPMIYGREEWELMQFVMRHDDIKDEKIRSLIRRFTEEVAARPENLGATPGLYKIIEGDGGLETKKYDGDTLDGTGITVHNG